MDGAAQSALRRKELLSEEIEALEKKRKELEEKQRKEEEQLKEVKIIASAGNRTRINCLEGSYAHHYTTDAIW